MAGRGGIDQRGDRWRVRYADGIDDAGRRRTRTRTFRTKKEAERFRAELIILDGGDEYEGRDFTLDQAIGNYYRTKKHSPTYRYDLKAAEKLIPADYLAITVGRLRPADLVRLYDELAAAGRSPWRVYRVHELIRGALGVAVRYEWIDRNVADIANPPRPRRITPDPPTPELLDRLLELAGGDLRLWLRIASTTGARRGEVAGLRWGDIDAGTIRIRRAVSSAPGTGLVIGPTKTGQERRVAIGAKLSAELDEARAATAGRLAMMGEELTDDLYVISADPAGRQPWRPDRATNAVRNLRDKHPELAGVRLKELRHYVATRALAGGADVRTVAGRLGHSQTSTTVDVYAAFVPESDQAIADALD